MPFAFFSRLLSPCLFLVVIFTSCSVDQTAETIGADFIDRCETVFEKRQLRKSKDLISENYHDEQGRTKQDIVSIATAYLFRNKNIHIYSRLSSAVQSGGFIELNILAALAGSPISDVGVLPKLEADMYWFDVTLVEEKHEWLVSRVSWRQAMLEDFLGE